MTRVLLQSEFLVGHHVRAVVDEKIVVVHPGEVIDRVLAERLGLVEPLVPPRPAGGRPPNLRRRKP